MQTILKEFQSAISELKYIKDLKQEPTKVWYLSNSEHAKRDAFYQHFSFELSEFAKEKFLELVSKHPEYKGLINEINQIAYDEYILVKTKYFNMPADYKPSTVQLSFKSTYDDKIKEVLDRKTA